MKTDKKIDIVLGACGKLDRSVKKNTIALIRKLIATRHLFPDALPGSSPATLPGNPLQPPSFDLDAPVQNFQLGSAGLQRHLHKIAPVLAENESVVASIRAIVNDSKPVKHTWKRPQDGFIPQWLALSVPRAWPADVLLFMLDLGHWSEIRMPGVDLQNADLRGVRWRNADLPDADMRNALLNHSDLGGSNLAAAKFGGATVAGADFTGADLSYSTGLTVTHGVTLTHAKLPHAQVVCDMDDPRIFDRLDDFVKLQLRTISTIARRHDELHNEVLWRLINATGAEHGRLKDIGPLANILLNQRRCWRDKRLTAFIDEKILPPLLAHWNLDPGEKYAISVHQAMAYILNTVIAIEWSKYYNASSRMLTNNQLSQSVDSAPRGAVALVGYLFDSTEFREPFIRALSQKPLPLSDSRPGINYGGPDADIHLDKQLRGFLRKQDSENPLVRIRQRNILWEKFTKAGTSLEDNPYNQARMMVCLSALLIRSTSSDLLGFRETSWRCIAVLGTSFSTSMAWLDRDVLPQFSKFSANAFANVSDRCQVSQLLAAFFLNKIATQAKTDPAMAICLEAIYPRAWMPQAILNLLAEPPEEKTAGTAKPTPDAPPAPWQ
ncbi:MAG TPA: pentapeptide repeat-containing protein [Herbaspirillum sp.]